MKRWYLAVLVGATFLLALVEHVVNEAHKDEKERPPSDMQLFGMMSAEINDALTGPTT